MTLVTIAQLRVTPTVDLMTATPTCDTISA
jgi:hypothetical protein